MSNGQACLEIEDRAPAGDVEASPPASGVRETLHTIPVPDGRSAAATVPGAGVDRFAETLPFIDESLAPPPIEWCVDLGARLITRTTFDLWADIEQGEIGGNMLVWREGMECWTPVDRVGELACALELAPVAAPLSFEQSPEPAEATTNPEVRRPPIEVDPPRISSRRRVPVRTANAAGGKWIALGSAVAASAIAAAALTTFLAHPEPAMSTRPREALAAPVVQGAAMSRELPEATSIDTAPTAAPPPPRAHHAESGQRRRR
jgi:uncharacterized protein DUF4339